MNALRQPWNRQFRESTKAYEALRVYLEMGPNRSYRAVSEQLGKSETLISRWGSRWNWRVRASEWDEEEHRRRDEVRAQVAAEIEAGKIRETEEMNKRHIGLSKLLQSKALERIQQMTPQDVRAIPLSVVVALVRDTARIEREARGIGDRLEVTGPVGGPIQTVIQYDLTLLSDEELETLERIVSKAARDDSATE
jgi:hypothetical protein